MDEIIRKTILSNFVHTNDPTNDCLELDGEWYAPKWGCDTLDHIIADIEALALLPPEGETRDDPCPKCGVVGCAECYGTGRLSGYQAHANTGEPAPSSEKAPRAKRQGRSSRRVTKNGRRG